MKIRIAASLALLATLSMLACSQRTTPAEDQQKIVATVNGKPLTKELFAAFADIVAHKPVGKLGAAERKDVLDKFIALQIAADAAQRDGMDKTDAVVAKLTLARMNTLSEAYLNKYADDHPASDAALRAEYDKQIAALSKQYHLRNILVNTQPDAEKIIAKLKAGADFAALAKQESQDPLAPKGGDMDWLPSANMLPEIARAVSKLDKGQITPQPVHTSFGWHVLKLEDTRIANARPFEAVKENVRALVRQQKMRAYLDDLRTAAKVEIADAAAKPATPAKQ